MVIFTLNLDVENGPKSCTIWCASYRYLGKLENTFCVVYLPIVTFCKLFSANYAVIKMFENFKDVLKKSVSSWWCKLPALPAWQQCIFLWETLDSHIWRRKNRCLEDQISSLCFENNQTDSNSGCTVESHCGENTGVISVKGTST